MEQFADLNERLDRLIVPIGEGDVLGKRTSVEGWESVEIRESDERLVDLAKDERLERFLILSPQYYQNFRKEIPGITERMWVRQGVADALDRASQLLPKGCRFQVWDAWRPLALEQALFYKYLESLREKEPELSYEDLRMKAQQFVSSPSKDLKKPSPHNTGGAVDLTLVGPDENELDMGTEFDHFGIEAETAYFEHRLRDGTISEQEIQILRNRRLLYSIMITTGFTNYPDEWWHYDFGNQFWGRIKGQAAIYGRAAPIELAESDEPCRF